MTVWRIDDEEPNWIQELQRSKGRIPSEPSLAPSGRATVVPAGELAYDPNQPRRADGKWGRGGGRGVARTVPQGGFRTGTVVGSDEVGAGKGDVPDQRTLDVVGGEIANPATTGRLYEIGVVLHPDGTPMMRESQQVKDYVEWNDGQIRQMEQAGNTSLLHNHPSGTSFSRDDVMFATNHNLASIHAYATSGDTDTSRETRRYSLFRPATGWQYTRAEYAYRKATDEVKDSNWAKIRAAGGDPDRTTAAIKAANETHGSQVMRRFAQVYNDGDDSGPGILHGDLGPADELRYEEGSWS